MGQQISYVGHQHLDVVREHGAAASVAEADLRSHVEKLIKLAQSSLADRLQDRYRSLRNANIQQQLRQEGVSVDSSPALAAQDTFPLNFTDISAVDLSFERDKYDMGVTDALHETVGLYCHVPMRKACKVDSCNIVCHSVCDSHHNTKANKGFKHLCAEPSCAKSDVFKSVSDQVTANENDVSESKASSEIFLNSNERGLDATVRASDADSYCRSRPPHSAKLITSSATVLQSAHESRPPEIGSYLAVAPVVSSSDLGLSPIDETAEVVPTTALHCHASTSGKGDSSKQATPESSSNAFSSGNDRMSLKFSLYTVHNSEVSELENSAASSFDNNMGCIHNPVKMALSQSDKGLMEADSSINAEVLRTVNNVLDEEKFCEDAFHSHMNTCTSFSALEGGSHEIDRFSRMAVKNSAQITTSGSSALQDEAAVFSDTKVDQRAKSNIRLAYSTPVDDQYQLSENKLVAATLYHGFPSEDDFSGSPQTSTPYFVLADTVNLSKNNDVSVNKSEQSDECFFCRAPELDVHASTYGRSNIDMTAFDPVWTEWETALTSCDWSTNNNESSTPESARRSMSPIAGPMIAKRHVRHSSENSAPFSSSLPSVREHTSYAGSQNRLQPDRSISQLSLDDIIVSPRTVPDRLDFQQLEKFEGRYSVIC